MKRIAILQKRKISADAELAKLYIMRQTLVEKNLTGIYSDEIFQKQNAIIEEKIKDLQVIKDVSLLNKYTLEETINFITEKFSDLGKTYKESSLEEKKALPGSIFPSGITWYHPGVSNHNIGPLFRAIHDFTSGVIHACEPSVPNLEPLLASYYTIYQNLKQYIFVI